jgi:hypothetical protein
MLVLKQIAYFIFNSQVFSLLAKRVHPLL